MAWVEGLHAAVEDFREAGDVFDVLHGNVQPLRWSPCVLPVLTSEWPLSWRARAKSVMLVLSYTLRSAFMGVSFCYEVGCDVRRVRQEFSPQ